MKLIPKRLLLSCLGLLLVPLLTFAAWTSFPADNHHGPRYVLWKLGLYAFNPRTVYGCMVADANRDSLVLGLTVEQLEQRFGLLRTKETANDFQRSYQRDLPDDIRWLGDSNWVVIFSNGKVAKLDLMKG
ncbi:MAG TPA: hypothetical protein VKX17_06475 [Planctomycetota bacterium]|nr:hypothetical protein [Planctomycetota bacterium]